MSNNWQTIDSKIILENRFMKVREDVVAHPNGKSTPYYVIDRSPFSIIIPLTPNSETYLVGQFRYAISRYSWEFPMGSVVGKNSLDIAKQELIEETGFTAKSWKSLGKFAIAPGHSSQTPEVFIAKDLTPGTAQPEEGEKLELKKVAVGDIPKMIQSGQIFDGVTISAYYLLTLHI